MLVVVLFVECYVLRVVQLWFDWPIWFMKEIWNILGPGVHGIGWMQHTWHDGWDSMMGVKLTRSIPYSDSNSKHETFHLIEPLPGTNAATTPPLPQTNASAATAVVSVHGGGFVTTCAEMYYNSLTPLVRKGFTVAALDYPLAPQVRHPEPLLAVLRALAFLYQPPYSMRDVHLIGDSAGANLILLAAAVIENPSLWPEFVQLANTNGWTFPKIHSAVSIYGMLSPRAAAEATGPVGMGLRFLWGCHGGTSRSGGISSCGGTAGKKGGMFCAFDDLLEDIQAQAISDGDGDGSGGGSKRVRHSTPSKVLPRTRSTSRRQKQQQGEGEQRQRKMPQLSTFSFPRTFFGVGDIDPLLGDTLKVHSRMKAMFTNEQVPLEMHVYPSGFHGFYGMPPEWQVGFVEAAAQPCGEDVARFLLRNVNGGNRSGSVDGSSIEDAASSSSSSDGVELRRGPRTLQHEYFGLAMLLLFILMPIAIGAPPLVACWWLYQNCGGAIA